MARKTTGNTTTNRTKKTAASVQPAAVQAVSEVPRNRTATSRVPTNLEEEIRCRAYELYLQRRATAGDQNGNGNGNENQDWLVAEREILSRHGGNEHHSA